MRRNDLASPRMMAMVIVLLSIVSILVLPERTGLRPPHNGLFYAGWAIGGLNLACAVVAYASSGRAPGWLAYALAGIAVWGLGGFATPLQAAWTLARMFVA